MTIDEYKQLLKNLKDAQGELTSAVCNDLQRLAGAEAESTKNKVREDYARGAEEMWEAAKTMHLMRPLGFEKFITPDHPEIKIMSDIWNLAGLNVIELYREYNTKKKAEAEKWEIHVGDEVMVFEKLGVAVAVCDGECVVLFPANERITHVKTSDCKKTGRKFKDVNVIVDAVNNLREAMK